MTPFLEEDHENRMKLAENLGRNNRAIKYEPIKWKYF